MVDMVFLTKLKPEPKGIYDASTAYGINSLVMSADGAAAYLSVKDVPAGTPLTNTEYWKIHTDLSLVKKNAEEAAEKALAARDEMIGIARNLTNPVETEGNPVQAALVGGLPFDKLVTVLEPVQAGSGDPYPAGGGPNLLPYVPETTMNGATIKTAEDGGVHISGTPTANTFFNIDCNIALNGTYVFSMGNKEAIGDHLQMRLLDESGNQGNTNVTAANADAYIIYPTAKTIKKFVIRLGAGVAYNVTIYPQLIAGTEKVEFHPYENIRPISGWTGAKMTRCGKNLWNGVIAHGSRGTPDLCGYAGPITIAAKSTNGTSQFNYRLIYTDGSDKNATIMATGWENGLWRHVQFTPEKPLKSVNFYSVDVASPREISGLAVMFDTHTVTDENYDPPQNATELSADFGPTVYGGTLDWKTDVLTVDRAMVTLDGTQIAVNRFIGTHGYMIVRYSVAGAAAVAAANFDVRLTSSTLKAVSADSQYVSMVNTIACNNSQDSLLVCIDGMTTEAEVTAWLAANPVQVVYPLANPTTIQLTPQEIAQLEGINTLYGDGSIAIIGRQKPDLALVSRIEALESAILNA